MHPDTDDRSDATEVERARAQAAFLGLALGDAWGRSLEFSLLPEVREQPVDLSAGVFHWTDDTQMSMYLGRAILDLPPGPLDQDQLGRAVGRRFAEWAEDPLTPRLAPGSTCLRGARAFARHRDWQRSGDRSSDGCGAVMRIVPIALAFEGAELVDAARVSAVVTHAHPNAVEAAIAGAWLCAEAVREGRFDEGMVARAIGHLGRDWDWGGTVAESLEAALEQAEVDEPWLDEEAIPPGDGGWRSGSALGLAVAAVLRWGREGFERTIEKAARIEGDSDSVACLAGMLLGASRGPAVLPVRWMDVLPERAALEQLALALWQRRQEDQERARYRPWSDEEPDTPTEASSAADEGEPAPGEEVSGEEVSGEEASGQPASGGEAAPASPAARAPRPTPAARPAAPRGVQLSLTGEAPPALPTAPPPQVAPAGPHTSLSDPLAVRWLDLSVAGARAPRGRIGLSAAPGRRDGQAWDRSLGADLDRLVALHKVDHLLLLLDPVEQAALGIAALAAEAEARAIVVHALPLAPGAAPEPRAARVAVEGLLAVARAGRRVVVVGREGEERPGLLGALALVSLGQEPEAAIRAVRGTAGPRAAAGPAQRALVETWARPSGD